MSVTQITKGSSEDLVFYPYSDYAPSTASLTITLATGSALGGFVWPQTVNRDSASTATSSASTRGTRTLTVSAVTDFIPDETYLLGIPDGRKFRIKLIGVNATAKQLFFDQPFPVDVPIGATVTGLAYRFTLNTTATSDVRRRIGAVWTYTVNGKSIRENQRFDIVRDPWILDLSESDLEKQDHCFGETAGNANRWQSLISGVGEYIQLFLEKRKIYADLVKDRDYLKTAAAYLLLSRFYGNRPGDDSQKISDKWKKEAETYLTNITSADIWYDSNDNGTLSDDTSVNQGEVSNELGLKAFYALVC